MKDIIYYNGEIITMRSKGEETEAVLIENGRIKKTGPLKSVSRAASGNAERVDLKGKTMLPSFLDPHSHITALASALDFARLGGARSFQDIEDVMKAFLKTQKDNTEFLVGCGYDHNLLKEGKHPDRRLLDQISTDRGIVIVHASGHMAVLNSRALELLSITETTSDPPGGKIGRMEESGEPDGYLEEKAFMAYSGHFIQGSEEDALRRLSKAQEVYASFGITTVQDGLSGEREFDLLKKSAERKSLKLDIVSYLDYNGTKIPEAERMPYKRRYLNRLKLGGYKIILDGSPQGRTAWLTKPYENSGDGYRGYPVYKDEMVREFAAASEEEGMQLLAHCNGDAACEQFIRAYEGKRTRLRPVMIHAQFVRADQLKRMKEIGMIPSFFTAHTWYWGDVHRKNTGEERAGAISPARTAGKLSLPYTFHQDSPVIMPDMLETIWCAVNRKTRSGYVLEGEEVSVWDAVAAVTKNAAYQYFEENRKGTIEEGKLADFVLLSGNPCNTDPEDIRKIEVLETIKEGESLYQKG